MLNLTPLKIINMQIDIGQCSSEIKFEKKSDVRILIDNGSLETMRIFLFS